MLEPSSSSRSAHQAAPSPAASNSQISLPTLRSVRMPGHHWRDLFVGEGQRIALIPPLLPSLQPSLQALLHSHPGELPQDTPAAGLGLPVAAEPQIPLASFFLFSLQNPYMGCFQKKPPSRTLI